MVKGSAALTQEQIEQEEAADVAVKLLYDSVMREYRQLKQFEGLNQRTLAKRMGVSEAKISQWFSKPSNMTIGTAAKLLCAMGKILVIEIR